VALTIDPAPRLQSLVVGESAAFAPTLVPLKDYVVVLACLTFGLTLLIVVLLSGKATYVVLFQILPAVLATLACSGGASLWLLARPPVRGWSMLVLPAVAGAAGMFGAIVLLSAVHGRGVDSVLARPLVIRGVIVSPLLGAMVGLSLLLLARARQRELAAWGRELSSRLSNERLQRERVLADLQLLQAQIEPHFLYNTLANLRQLIRVDSTRALAMLEHLIRYFKLALPSFRSDRLPLGDELALVQAYLELLRERLGRPMRLVLNVPPDWHAVPLLPGALLCLAENAVKHGLPDDGAELVLHIDALHVGQALRLTLRDNGPGLAEPRGAADSTGTGLRNLRERLRLIYGDAATLQLRDHGHGCEAVLDLPWQ
jgi:Histidine kinase